MYYRRSNISYNYLKILVNYGNSTTIFRKEISYQKEKEEGDEGMIRTLLGLELKSRCRPNICLISIRTYILGPAQ